MGTKFCDSPSYSCGDVSPEPTCHPHSGTRGIGQANIKVGGIHPLGNANVQNCKTIHLVDVEIFHRISTKPPILLVDINEQYSK